MTLSELIRPPRLQHSETDEGKQRTASWLEVNPDQLRDAVATEVGGVQR